MRGNETARELMDAACKIFESQVTFPISLEKAQESSLRFLDSHVIMSMFYPSRVILILLSCLWLALADQHCIDSQNKLPGCSRTRFHKSSYSEPAILQVRVVDIDLRYYPCRDYFDIKRFTTP